LLLAWLLRAAVVRLATRLGHWLPRLLPGGARRFSHPGRLAALLGAITFWVVLLAFIGAATQVWGLTLFADWFDRILAHLPVAAFAVLILVAGFVLGQFVRDGVAEEGVEARRRGRCRWLHQGARIGSSLSSSAETAPSSSS
jgi:hypothetical protein